MSEFNNWFEFFELYRRLNGLANYFINSDIFIYILDFLKIILSIIATVYFGRQYVNRHLQSLLDRHINEIVTENRTDRNAVILMTSEAIEKSNGRKQVKKPFNIKSVFGLAAKYHAQRQTKYAIELLERRTIILEAAANLSDHKTHIARFEAATAQLQIAMFHRDRGNTNAELDAYQKILRINPDDIDGLRFIGQKMEEQGRLSEAEEYYKRMKRIAVQNDDKILQGEAMRSLARVDDNVRDAIRTLEDCLQFEKSMHRDLGIAYTWKTIGDLRAKKEIGSFQRKHTIMHR